MRIPQPGIEGDYRDSCIGNASKGHPGIGPLHAHEWAMAGLRVLGVPPEQAEVIVSKATGCDVGLVPAGVITVAVQVCASCASASATGMTVGLVATGVPNYSPRS